MSKIVVVVVVFFACFRYLNIIYEIERSTIKKLDKFQQTEKKLIKKGRNLKN